MEINHGEYCGNSIILGTNYEIFTKDGHFGRILNNEFKGHVKRSTIRQAGIFCPYTKKKLYGEQGYVGAPKKVLA